jgi:hypothetical protein
MPPVNDREDLHRNWLGWVTTNLGRDARLAEIAASAATDAAGQGRGFNNATEAARIAWADAAKRYSKDHRWWWDGQHWTPASQAMQSPALEVVAASQDGQPGPREAQPPGASRARSLFFALVAVVIGILVLPIVGAAGRYLVLLGLTLDRAELVAPLIVTLLGGFAVGLFSRSWRLALLCSWFIAPIGLFGLFVALLDFGFPFWSYGPVALDLPLGLLLGGLVGAAAGGYLGAKLRGAD